MSVKHDDLLNELSAIVHDQTQPLGNRLQMIDSRIKMFQVGQHTPPVNLHPHYDLAMAQRMRDLWNQSNSNVHLFADAILLGALGQFPRKEPHNG